MLRSRLLELQIAHQFEWVFLCGHSLGPTMAGFLLNLPYCTPRKKTKGKRKLESGPGGGGNFANLAEDKRNIVTRKREMAGSSK